MSTEKFFTIRCVFHLCDKHLEIENDVKILTFDKLKIIISICQEHYDTILALKKTIQYERLNQVCQLCLGLNNSKIENDCKYCNACLRYCLYMKQLQLSSIFIVDNFFLTGQEFPPDLQYFQRRKLEENLKNSLLEYIENM